MDNTKLTGGTAPLVIHGKEYSARVFTDLDYAELDEYVQFAMITLAKNYADKFASTLNERQEIVQAAIKSASGLRWSSNEGAKILSSPIGMSRLAYQMIKRQHPKLSFEEFFNHMISKGPTETREVIREIDRVYARLNTLTEEERAELDKADAERTPSPN